MHLEVPNRDRLPMGLIPDRLSVERVLYEAEEPILFLTRTSQNQLLLAYVADDSASGMFTVLTPVTIKTVDALERGITSVRDAITSAAAWLHWTKGKESGTWPFDLESFPDTFLPHPGTPLLPQLEPVLRTRAIGPNIVLGHMPASVVAFVADSTRKAMKTLLDYTLSAKTEGRPREEHRTLYDLPIQSFAFSSFELGFGPPDEGLFTVEQVRQASEKLAKGLLWATSGGSIKLEAESDEEREVILRATLLLTPPITGPISEVQLSGNWVPHDKIVLTRDSRKRVRQELKQVDSERVFTFEGRIGELDIDNQSFILRDTTDGQDRRGFFAEDLLDEMLALLSESEKVIIAGVERQGKLRVSAVAPARNNNDADLPAQGTD
jgi:hypothetical protein